MKALNCTKQYLREQQTLISVSKSKMTLSFKYPEINTKKKKKRERWINKVHAVGKPAD